MDGNINSRDMGLSKLQETAKDREAWRAAVHGAAASDGTERLKTAKHVVKEALCTSLPLHFLHHRQVLRCPIDCTVFNLHLCVNLKQSNKMPFYYNNICSS